MDELRKRGGSLGRTEASDMLSTLESRISLLIGQVLFSTDMLLKMVE